MIPQVESFLCPDKQETPEEGRRKPGGYSGRNVVEITIKMKTIVRKLLLIKIIKPHLRNFDNECVDKSYI